MPALIMFVSSGATNGAAARSDRLKVKEDADAVVQKLGTADGGFADFSPGNKPNQKVWINRDQVRMVRSA